MAKRDNHYECAFEEYLRGRQLPYVAVDEARRSLLAGGSLKSLDFLVTTPRGGWLVDVKGRLFGPGQHWKNWSTRDDLQSLARWESVFGPGFHGLFVFAYHVVADVAPLPAEQLFRHRDGLYAFVGVPLRHYAFHARRISPRWDTVAMPVEQFRRVAAPLAAIL
jgi:hypothetical protein